MGLLRNSGPGVAALISPLKTSLQALQAIAAVIPVPCVIVAASAALQVVCIIETISSNQDDLHELASVVSKIAYAAIQPLQGKDIKSIPPSLEGSIRRLGSDLMKIQDELRRISGMNKVQRTLQYSSIAQRIQRCSTVLQWAIGTFQVETQIDGRLQVLDAIESNADKLASLLNLQSDAILSIAPDDDSVKQRLRIGPSVQLPPPPEIFFGRTEYIDGAIKRILGDTSPRLAILGPGGMGKTSIALKIMHDDRILERFSERRHWVPCDAAETPELLVELIARGLHIPESKSQDRLQEVVAFLKADSAEPRIILLDNFETPLDLDGYRSQIDNILCFLSSVQNVALLFTMRGSQLPCAKIRWTQPFLPPVDCLSLENARQTFLELDREAENDENLDTLLVELDCMPLAITLMATIGRAPFPTSPTQLLEKWRKEAERHDQDGLLHVSGDRLNSVDVSIGVSVDSTTMKNHPEALVLLSVLSMLPAGVLSDFLPQLAPQLRDVDSALTALLSVTLALVRPGGTIHVLSPVRSYIARRHPPSREARLNVHAAYGAFIRKNQLPQGDPEYFRARLQLSREGPNIETALMDALRNGDRLAAIASVVIYAEHLFWTSPRAELLLMAESTARESGGTHLIAQCLYEKGRIFWVQSRNTEAISTFQEARKLYLDSEDSLGAAQALWNMADCHYVQSKYDEARAMMEKAKDEYRNLDHLKGVAQCLQIIGRIHHRQGRYQEARDTQQEAYDAFVKVKDVFGAAQCVQCVGRVDQAVGRYEEAIVALKAACEDFRKIGDHRGVSQCLNSLAEIYTVQEAYEDAWKTHSQAFEGFKRLGNVRGATHCLRGMGELRLKQGRTKEAQATFEVAYRESLTVSDSLSAHQCLELLADICLSQELYDKARLGFLEAAGGYEKLGYRLGLANCMCKLGRIHQRCDRPDQALESFRQARSTYIELSINDPVVECDKAIAALTRTSSVIVKYSPPLSSSTWIYLIMFALVFIIYGHI